MGLRAVQWAMQQEELTPMMHWVLVRVAWSVMDETGVLDRSPEWLARKCGLSDRSCRRHVLELEKLGLLCRRRSGYAIPIERPPVAATGQNRHIDWPPVAATGKEKESTKEKERDLDLGKEETCTRETDPWGAQEFNFAICSICPVPHEFPVDESYFNVKPRRFACPLVVAKYKPEGVSR